MRAATRAGVGSCPNLITASSAPNETERDKQKRKKRRDANRSGRLRKNRVRQINLSCRPRAITNDKGKTGSRRILETWLMVSDGYESFPRTDLVCEAARKTLPT